MTQSPEPNFDSMAVAREIIELEAEKDRQVQAAQYEQAATLRDQRAALELHLAEFGDPLVARNVKISLQLGPSGLPVLAMLEKVESAVDPELLQRLNRVSLPPRWILNGLGACCRATVAERLKIDSLESAYFRAQLPVLSSATLAKATHPLEWLAAAVREAAREISPVVWIVEEPAYLAERGVLDVVMQVLRLQSTQFVVSLQAGDADFPPLFAELAMKIDPSPVSINDFLDQLLPLLREASNELLAKADRLYAGQYDSRHGLARFIEGCTTELSGNDMRHVQDLWNLFAPTCEWDDAGGSQDVANKAFALLERLRRTTET